MAQIARAILLANAIATSIFGYRSSMRPSQDPGGTGFRPIQFSRDIAPINSKRRMSDCPAFDILPSRSLPPEGHCLGTSPSQAVKSRPRLNVVIGGAKASMAKAERGPIPGTVCGLLAIVVRIAKVLIASVLEPVRKLFERFHRFAGERRRGIGRWAMPWASFEPDDAARAGRKPTGGDLGDGTCFVGGNWRCPTSPPCRRLAPAHCQGHEIPRILLGQAFNPDISN